MLMYLEKFVKNDRLFKQADPNFEYVVREWSGKNVISKHDVIVIRGSTAPQSLAVKRNEIMNIYQQGLLGDQMNPEVKQKVLRSLEFGDVTGVWEDQSIDMAQIKRSLHEIEMGIAPEVNELDNHALHIQEKNKYRKSEKFNSLPPNEQALLIADIEAHVQALMKLTAPQFGLSPNDDVDDASAETQLLNTAASAEAEAQEAASMEGQPMASEQPA